MYISEQNTNFNLTEPYGPSPCLMKVQFPLSDLIYAPYSTNRLCPWRGKLDIDPSLILPRLSLLILRLSEPSLFGQSRLLWAC